MVAVWPRAGGEGEGVGAGGGFGEGVGADGVGCHAREVLLLLRFGAPAKEGVDGEGVLHVDQDADCGVDCRDLFYGEDGAEEGGADAAVFFGNLDAHEAELKEAGDDFGRHLLGFVHLADEGRDLFAGELADGFLEDLLFGGEGGKRPGEGGFGGECGHERGISGKGLRSYSTRG